MNFVQTAEFNSTVITCIGSQMVIFVCSFLVKHDQLIKMSIFMDPKHRVVKGLLCTTVLEDVQHND